MNDSQENLQLEEDERRYRFLTDGLSQFIWIMTPDGVVTYCNQWWHDYSGLDQHAVLGNTWTAPLHPNDIASAQELWRQAQDLAIPYEGELRFRRMRKDDYRWHLVRLLPITDKHGVVTMVIGAAVDIHKGKAAVRTLVATEQQLRLIIDASPVSISYIDPDRCFRFANRAYANNHQLEPADMVGRSIDSLRNENAIRVVEERLESALYGNPQEFDLTYRCPDRGELQLHANYVPDTSDDGHVRGVVTVITDITRRIRTEGHTRFLAQLGHHVVRTGNPDDAISTVVHAVGEYMKLTRCLLSKINREANQVQVHSDYHLCVPSAVGHYRLSSFSPWAADELQAGRIIIITDAAQDPRCEEISPFINFSFGLRASVCLPLMRDGSWAGCLVIADNEPRVWLDEDIGLLRSIGDLLVVCAKSHVVPAPS